MGVLTSPQQCSWSILHPQPTWPLEGMCYIIKEWFFYINHFSLIIFYHSVWLGFELFGLRVQVHNHWVQFYARAQRTWQEINHLTGNEAGVWMTSYPEEMVLRIWGFWKREVEIGTWRQRVDFLPLRHRLEFSTVAAVVNFFGSRPAEMNWDLKHHEMRCASGCG